MKQNEIMEAIGDLLEAHGCRVYTMEVPRDFVRPCVLIVPVRQTRRDSTYRTQRITQAVTLCGYLPVDAYRRSSPVERAVMQDALLDLFVEGGMAVGDRYIKTTASSGGMDEESVYVDLTLEFDEDRARPMPGADAVGKINLRVEGNRNGTA